MTWTVRRARVTDATELARVNVVCWQRAYRGIMPDAILDQMSPRRRVPGWERWLAQPEPHAVFVAVDDEDRVGAYCGVSAARERSDEHPRLNTAELACIYADPDRWGTGAGAAVHRAAINYLAAAGFGHAVLWVFHDNLLARNFYRAHGWCDDGVTKYLEIDGHKIPERRYSRPVP